MKKIVWCKPYGNTNDFFICWMSAVINWKTQLLLLAFFVYKVAFSRETIFSLRNNNFPLFPDIRHRNYIKKGSKSKKERKFLHVSETGNNISLLQFPFTSTGQPDHALSRIARDTLKFVERIYYIDWYNTWKHFSIHKWSYSNYLGLRFSVIILLNVLFSYIFLSCIVGVFYLSRIFINHVSHHDL